MNTFLSGFISILLLFSFCFTVSACLHKILSFKIKKPKAPQRRKRRPSQAIYYIEQERPEPKPQKQTIAIKGTLLSKAELEKIKQRKINTFDDEEN